MQRMGHMRKQIAYLGKDRFSVNLGEILMLGLWSRVRSFRELLPR